MASSLVRTTFASAASASCAQPATRSLLVAGEARRATSCAAFSWFHLVPVPRRQFGSMLKISKPKCESSSRGPHGGGFAAIDALAEKMTQTRKSSPRSSPDQVLDASAAEDVLDLDAELLLYEADKRKQRTTTRTAASTSFASGQQGSAAEDEIMVDNITQTRQAQQGSTSAALNGESEFEIVDEYGRLVDPETGRVVVDEQRPPPTKALFFRPGDEEGDRGSGCPNLLDVDVELRQEEQGVDSRSLSGGTAPSSTAGSAEPSPSRKASEKRSEAVIRAEVKESIDYLSDEFVRQSTVDETAKKTPAQLFLAENRERLLQKAQQYYFERESRELTTDTEEDWAYYKDPVIRPPKGHLWSMTDDEHNDFENNEDEDGVAAASSTTSSRSSTRATSRTGRPRVRPEDFQKGVMPAPELLRDLLLQEEATDVQIVDLEKCGRRDYGKTAIVATGQTAEHALRMGRLLFKTVRALDVPFIRPYCRQQRHDQWVQARLGPIVVHIFSSDIRKFYKLETLYEAPEEFFRPGDFPHFVLDSMEYSLRTKLTEPDDVGGEILDRVYDSDDAATGGYGGEEDVAGTEEQRRPLL